MPTLAGRIADLCGVARFQLRAGQRARAEESAAEATALFATLPPDDPARGQLAPRFADLFKLLGRLDDSEAQIRSAIALAAPDTTELGTRQMFLATLLRERGRLDEAERVALAARPNCAEPGYCDRLVAEIRAQRAG